MFFCTFFRNIAYGSATTDMSSGAGFARTGDAMVLGGHANAARVTARDEVTAALYPHSI